MKLTLKKAFELSIEKWEYLSTKDYTHWYNSHADIKYSFPHLFILEGESNPIYLLTNSVLALWLLKLLIVGLVFYVYFYNNYTSRYVLFSYIYIFKTHPKTIKSGICFGDTAFKKSCFTNLLRQHSSPLLIN